MVADYKHVITIDFETYYDSDYTLTKLPTAEYVMDPRFEIIGCAYKLDDGPTVWVPSRLDNAQRGADGVYEWIECGGPPEIRHLPWCESMLVAHNAQFDGLILAVHYGIIPARYFCTMMAARPVFAPLTGSTSLKALAEHLGIGQKGTESYNAKGLRLRDFPAQQLAEYAEYCKNDCSLTYMLYNILITWFEQNNRNVA